MAPCCRIFLIRSVGGTAMTSIDTTMEGKREQYQSQSGWSTNPGRQLDLLISQVGTWWLPLGYCSWGTRAVARLRGGCRSAIYLGASSTLRYDGRRTHNGKTAVSLN